MLLEMGEKWRKASDSQVDLVVYPGSTQGSEADVVKRMSTGQLQAGMLSVGGLTEIDPSVAALQEIPMLFKSLAEEEYVIDKLRPDLEKRLARSEERRVGKECRARGGPENGSKEE